MKVDFNAIYFTRIRFSFKKRFCNKILFCNIILRCILFSTWQDTLYRAVRQGRKTSFHSVVKAKRRTYIEISSIEYYQHFSTNDMPFIRILIELAILSRNDILLRYFLAILECLARNGHRDRPYFRCIIE